MVAPAARHAPFLGHRPARALAAARADAVIA
jgi:hypothetical protein